jgi:hypothetical protein
VLARASVLLVLILLPGLAAGNVSEAVAEPGSSADAADEETQLAYSRSGGYIGVGGTFAVESFSAIGNQDDGASVIFRAGYRGYPFFAVEFLGEVMPLFEGTDAIDNDVNGFAVTVNAKALWPLGRAEPYAMVGIGILDIDQDIRNRRDDFAFRGAAGVDFYLSPSWALYGEAAYLVGTGDVSDFDYATFGGGILFRF